MSTDTYVTVIGNLTDSPTLRRTASGVAVVNFTVASTPRKFDRNTGEWVDEETIFMPCVLWRRPAEYVAVLTRGTRIIVAGKLKQRSYDSRDGEQRTVLEVEVEEVGPSVRYGAFQPVGEERTSSGGAGTATEAPASHEDVTSASAAARSR